MADTEISQLDQITQNTCLIVCLSHANLTHKTAATTTRTYSGVREVAVLARKQKDLYFETFSQERNLSAFNGTWK